MKNITLFGNRLVAPSGRASFRVTLGVLAITSIALLTAADRAESQTSTSSPPFTAQGSYPSVDLPSRAPVQSAVGPLRFESVPSMPAPLPFTNLPTSVANANLGIPPAGVQSAGSIGDTDWHKVIPRADYPQERYGPAGAYDEARGEIVMFGGGHYPGGSLVMMNETWTYDGVKWTKRTPAITPPPRIWASAAYDSKSGRVIIFGGLTIDATTSQFQPLNDTWAWDGSEWTQLTPTNSPPARLVAAMAYDKSSGNVVLFGGIDNFQGNFLGDTWVFDGTTWNKADPPVSPSARVEPGMAYVPTNGGLLLFGGLGGANENYPKQNDTWLWKDNRWTQLSPASAPPARYYPRLAYDSARSKAVVFLFSETVNLNGPDASNYGETWLWDGNNWEKSPAASPPSRYDPLFVYDPSRSKILMFGGALCGLYDEQWEWNGLSWGQVDLGQQPRVNSASITFDTAADQAVLFGGEGHGNCGCLSETRLWNGAGWKLASPSATPPGRVGASMAYDAERKVTVLFGGQTGSSSFGDRVNDTWTFDGVNWVKQSPATSPPARDVAAMAYDSISRKVVLFGGVAISGITFTTFTDTWTWDGSTWTQEQPLLSPPGGREAANMARDADGRPVLFGGLDRVTFQTHDDTWRWNGTSRDWEAVVPPDPTQPQPPRRWYAAMGYDASRRSIILFGGATGITINNPNPFYGDTWAFDGTEWKQLNPGASPGSRWRSAMADGSATSPPILVGGTDFANNNANTDDAWIWGAPVPPVPLTSVVSRKAHGSAGSFDINLPLTGSPGVECRKGGANGDHKLVFTFANPVTVNGTPDKARVTSGTGTVSSVTVNGAEVTVDLTGVTNAQKITLTLFGVNDGTNTSDVSVSMGVLLGDVNASSVVDGNDVSAVQGQTRRPVNLSTFRYDVNGTGVIDGNDVSTTQSKTRTRLP